MVMPSPWSWPTLCILGWLAWRFGKTLQRSNTPLIEQIARASTPQLTTGLCRYTRFLTALWCIYFLVAISAFFISTHHPLLRGLLIGSGSIMLFLIEYWLRPYLFKGITFPGLRTQIVDTWQVWNKMTAANALGQPDP